MKQFVEGNMKLLSIACFLFLTVISHASVLGTISLNGETINYDEINTQEIKQLHVHSLGDKIEINFELKDLTESPRQFLFTIGNNLGLEQYFVPSFDMASKRAKLSIPIKRISPSLLVQATLFLKMIVAGEQVSPNIYSNLIEIIPTAEFISTVDYSPVERLAAKPEIYHTFKSDPETVNAIIPVVFVGFAIILFTLLLTFWSSQVGSELFGSYKVFASQGSVANYGFIISLLGIECVFAMYYYRLSIFSAIYYVFYLSVVSLACGKYVFEIFEKLLKVNKA